MKIFKFWERFTYSFCGHVQVESGEIYLHNVLFGTAELYVRSMSQSFEDTNSSLLIRIISKTQFGVKNILGHFNRSDKNENQQNGNESRK